MSEHLATVAWQRGTDTFEKGRYSRVHEWRFDGGVVVPASASPDVVPAPWSDANAVDPEEAFVAALSSCHMLWFLSLTAAKGFIVDSYKDDAVGHMLEIADAGRCPNKVLRRAADVPHWRRGIIFDVLGDMRRRLGRVGQKLADGDLDSVEPLQAVLGKWIGFEHQVEAGDMPGKFVDLCHIVLPREGLLGKCHRMT